MGHNSLPGESWRKAIRRHGRGSSGRFDSIFSLHGVQNGSIFASVHSTILHFQCEYGFKNCNDLSIRYQDWYHT